MINLYVTFSTKDGQTIIREYYDCSLNLQYTEKEINYSVIYHQPDYQAYPRKIYIKLEDDELDEIIFEGIPYRFSKIVNGADTVFNFFVPTEVI